jgi:hypothetical protein
MANYFFGTTVEIIMVQTYKPSFMKKIVIAVVIVLVSLISVATVHAQTGETKKVETSITSSIIDGKAKIYITNFPKNSLVVLSDEKNSLISIVTTNDAGCAVVNLDQQAENSICAKTINGEVYASAQAPQLKNAKPAQDVAVKTATTPAAKS